MSQRHLYIEVTNVDASSCELVQPGPIALLYRRGRVQCVGPSMEALVDAIFGAELHPQNRQWLGRNMASTAARAYPDGVTLWPYSAHVAVWSASPQTVTRSPHQQHPSSSGPKCSQCMPKPPMAGQPE